MRGMKLSTPSPDERTFTSALAFLKAPGGGLSSGTHVTVSGWHRAFVPADQDDSGSPVEPFGLRAVGWCCFVSSGSTQPARLWIPSQPGTASPDIASREPAAIELESGDEVQAWIAAVNKAHAKSKRYQELVYEPGFVIVLDKMSSALVLMPQDTGEEALAMPLCYRAKARRRMNLVPLTRFLARCG
jgi:hypothetical protein